MSRHDRDDDGDLAAAWRRLRRAAIFFGVCLTIVMVLGAIGLYH